VLKPHLTKSFLSYLKSQLPLKLSYGVQMQMDFFAKEHLLDRSVGRCLKDEAFLLRKKFIFALKTIIA
jgi:hypothetical protein